MACLAQNAPAAEALTPGRAYRIAVDFAGESLARMGSFEGRHKRSTMHENNRLTRGCGVLVALALGCGSATGAGPKGGGALALQQGADEPPHVFTARSHPPRSRPAPPPVDVSAMPRMVERSAQCFAGDREDVVAPKKSKPKGKKKRTPSGFVPFSPTPGAATPTTPPSTTTSTKSSKPKKPRPAKNDAKPSEAPLPEPASPPPADSSSPSLGGAADDGGDESARSTVQPVSPSAPPTFATDKSNGEAEQTIAKKESRADRKAERQARRERNKSKDSALAPVQTEEAPSSEVAVAQADPADAYHDWGASIYLSNDDSMSLSSAQRVIFAIDKFLPLPIEHIRPHELLNYFSFDTTPVPESDDFSVKAEIAQNPDKPGIYDLALAVAGRPLDRESRRNTALTLVVDRSGSMADEGRMEYLKQGLHRMTSELKPGDMINIVMFDHEVCAPLENFVVGRDPQRLLGAVIDRMEPRGSTDVHLGLTRGYELADRGFQQTHGNRVMLVTDALANSGVTDEDTIAMVGKFYDSRRIRLSGVGVGTEFNDALIDRLTERGRGAYVFLGSPAEVDAVFGPRFVSLIETTANDVHFQLHLPPSLRMNVFYGEESSTVKEDVQSIHYFANTSQLFLSELMAKHGKMRPQDSVMLTVEYEDPETGDDMVEEFAFNLGEIADEDKNVRKSRMLMHFIDGLAVMATRPIPSSWAPQRAAWIDEGGFDACEAGRADLSKMASGISDDPEVRRVAGLWDRFCSRFEQPRRPVKRAVPTSTSWPSARE